MRPAWSAEFDEHRLGRVAALPTITDEWAFGNATGRGIRVAVLDTGIEASHPAIGGVARSVGVLDGAVVDVEPVDPHGHGTACSGIIRSIAPDVELWNVRVLAATTGGSFEALQMGLEWVIDERVDVVNLSLSTSSRRTRDTLWELCDRANFAGVAIVGAMSNDFAPAFPSQFASVFSVAALAADDERGLVALPGGPPEFGAWGIDVDIAWVGGSRIVATGNSFAAPRVAGMLARLRERHPMLSLAQCKAVLTSLAANSDASEPVVPTTSGALSPR